MSDTFLGIVVGSGFTALGVLLQGLVSWFLDYRRHERTLRLQEMMSHKGKGMRLKECVGMSIVASLTPMAI